MGDFAFSAVSLPPSHAPSDDDPRPSGRQAVRAGTMRLAPHAGGATDISGVAVTVDLGGKSAWGWVRPETYGSVGNTNRPQAPSLLHGGPSHALAPLSITSHPHQPASPRPAPHRRTAFACGVCVCRLRVPFACAAGTTTLLTRVRSRSGWR